MIYSIRIKILMPVPLVCLLLINLLVTIIAISSIVLGKPKVTSRAVLGDSSIS